MPREMNVMPEFQPGEIRAPSIPLFQYQKSLSDEMRGGVPREDLLYLYELMLLNRHFEDIIVRMKSGTFEPAPGFKFTGATHLSLGQEAVAAGAIASILPSDFITSTHRGHGHSIVKTAVALKSMADVEKVRLLEAVSPRAFEGESLDDKILNLHLFRTMAELFGKEEGYCRGRGGGMHIADFNTGHLGANAIVGGSYAIAVGAALGARALGKKSLVLCLMGDGAANNGICHEAYNFASMKQFQAGTPVIFLIENNQYGMTGQQCGEVTGVRYLAQRALGYNEEGMHAEVVNGMDVMAVRDSVLRAAELCRSGKGPVVVECRTYRFMGHSLSDQRSTYRSPEEEQAWSAVDPIKVFREKLIEAGLLDAAAADRMEGAARARIELAAKTAALAADPNPATIREGLFSDTVCETVEPPFNQAGLSAKPRKYARDAEGKIMGRHAVAEALAEEMIRDRRVVVFGEDVADYGGAFQATHGLLKVFGRERVFNTPISEACIAGAAVGLAMAGMRPVCEIMYIDFLPLALDQVGNQAAKTRYMFGGKAKIPMVLRTTVGGGKGYAGQHSQSLEALAAHFPGLKVIMPSNPYDTKGLLKSAIRSDDPVIFIEHQLLYTEKGKVPETEYALPIGKAAIARQGKDVTVIAYSWMLTRALEAAALAEKHGVSVEVVDPRTLVPLDEKTLCDSARRTGRALCVSQAPGTGCFGEHIAFVIQGNCFDALKKPVALVAAREVPPPMAPSLENENLPGPEKILKAILRLMEK